MRDRTEYRFPQQVKAFEACPMPSVKVGERAEESAQLLSHASIFSLGAENSGRVGGRTGLTHRLQQHEITALMNGSSLRIRLGGFRTHRFVADVTAWGKRNRRIHGKLPR